MVSIACLTLTSRHRGRWEGNYTVILVVGGGAAYCWKSIGRCGGKRMRVGKVEWRSGGVRRWRRRRRWRIVVMLLPPEKHSKAERTRSELIQYPISRAKTQPNLPSAFASLTPNPRREPAPDTAVYTGTTRFLRTRREAGREVRPSRSQ